MNCFINFMCFGLCREDAVELRPSHFGRFRLMTSTHNRITRVRVLRLTCCREKNLESFVEKNNQISQRVCYANFVCLFKNEKEKRGKEIDQMKKGCLWPCVIEAPAN